MNSNFDQFLSEQLDTLKQTGLYKDERILTSPQQAVVTTTQNNEELINLCANNYLGLSNHPALIESAQSALENSGYGMSSVRFICGTQEEHKQLEANLSAFLGKQDTILYSSCFDANTGLFETLLDENDAIISDALNHASIIDGVRLCKARRFRYTNNNMDELEKCLRDAKDCRYRLIATDGVFSMDGIIANLPGICDLAEKHDALVMVDDSHAVGFLGPNGAGTPDYWDVTDRVDIITGTLGKALGGASGGYTAATKEIVNWLRQRSRPYLFSNALAPVITATSLTVLDLLQKSGELRDKLKSNSDYFRKEMTALGFDLVPGDHPIIPVMLGDAQLAKTMADKLLKEGIFVVGFSFPVVPKGQARIRTQMSAALEVEHLDSAIAAFTKVGRKLDVIT